MKHKRRKAQEDSCFHSLVTNAIDFMREAIELIATKPKYSLINFYTATELFLKARLLNEHWTLIIQKPESATLGDFESGDFHSVSLQELQKRLRNICGVKLNKGTLECFDALRNHRNRAVHFFNKQYLSESEDSIRKIVAEQCKAWYRLHKLIALEWEQEFRNYTEDIKELDEAIHKHRAYLLTKFDEISPELENVRADGERIGLCPSCDFLAAIESNILGPIFSQHCKVCSNNARYIETTCKSCNEDVKIFDPQLEKCPKCDMEISISSLQDEYSDFVSPKEAMIESQVASCSECQGYETAGRIDEAWVCFSCLQIFDSHFQCGWCGQNITGEYEDTTLDGCENCDGRIGWRDD